MRVIRTITSVLFVLIFIVWVLSGILINRNKDEISPVITSDNDLLQLSVTDDESRLMEGLSASDNMDGDLTGEIIIGSRSNFTSPGITEITYLVFDSSNNVGSYTRKVEYTDYQSPLLSLKEPLIFNPGAKVSVQDYLTVTDCIEGDISSRLKVVSSDVNIDQDGEYTINVEVSNSYGDKISAELPIIVINRRSNAPDIELSNYLVYVKAGTSFNPDSYLRKIMLSNGTAGEKDNISISSNVDTAVAGCYAVKYVYSDSNDVIGCTVLTVIVTE